MAEKLPVIIDNRGDNKVLHALQRLLPNLQRTTLYFSEFPLSVRYYSVTEQDTHGGYVPAMDHIEPFSTTMDEMIDEKRLRQIISEDDEDDDLYCSELKRLGIAQEDINRLSRFEPLTPNAKNLIITACGSGEIICIKKFLERNVPNENFNSASWLEILWAIYHIQRKDNIEWRHISNIPQIIDELSGYIKQKCPSRNDYINEQINKMKCRPFFKAQMESQKSAGAGQELTKTITKSVVADQKTIWGDISPDMKKAIQGYWEESKALKSEGKRLLIKKFCRKRDLDESTFRSERDRVEKRKNRSGWADQ
jgi:hypothetical protein